MTPTKKLGQTESKQEPVKNPLELWGKIGGRTGRVNPVQGSGPEDSLLAAYQDRITYTFILDNQVASIHFNKVKREIYFRGHNIQRMECSSNEINALRHFSEILRQNPKGKPFAAEYEATLGLLLADK